MRRCLNGILLLAAAALPALAAAQSPKLAIGPLKGDSSRVRQQLLLELCGPYQCVAASKVTTEGKPDPAKLARAGVAGYLSGAVTGEPGERHLSLSLATPQKTAARTWKFKLTTDGKLRQSSVDRFAGEVGEALSPGGPAPKAAAQPPSAPPPAVPPPPRPPPPEAAPPDKAKPLPPGAAQPRAAAVEKPHELRFALEAGAWLTSRHLTYTGASAADPTPLRTFDASMIFVPELRGEVYPGAFMDAGRPWSGLGAYLQYGHSVGLKVKPPADVGGGERSSALTELAVGALWRLQPISGSKFTVTPALGYRSLSVVTSGDDIPGLPDTELSGVEGRVDLDIPVTARVTVLAGGGYEYWTSAKELVGTFFPSGSARGFQVQGGVDVKVVKPLSIRGLLDYEAVDYSLKKGTTGVFTATGAKDTYLGGHVDARLEF